MKYVIVIPDGCADEPQATLGGKTPLEAANTPAMDEVARLGVSGESNNVPAHLPAGSAVANMSLLGYDPNEHFTGRAPLEAAAQNIQLGPEDWAIRCNLVTIQNQIMQDFTADHISSADAANLLTAAQEKLVGDGWEFVPGVSYRNLLLYRGKGRESHFSNDTLTTPPHDLTDKSVLSDYPKGPGSELLCDIMSRSMSLFEDHDVNRKNQADGKLPATNVWLWGLGRSPDLESFESRYGKVGKMITAVDLLRGIAALIGWDRIEVPGATGYTDTDYAAKGRYAIDGLADTDLMCVHVEATDEASHEGDAAAKIQALERIDADIVAPLHEALRDQGDYRLLISPDHPTPIRTKTHSHGAVPFAICGRDVRPDSSTAYSEPQSTSTGLRFQDGWKLMNYFLNEG